MWGILNKNHHFLLSRGCVHFLLGTLEQMLSVEGQIVTIFGFVGHWSLTATELCPCAGCLLSVCETTVHSTQHTQYHTGNETKYEHSMGNV